MRERARLDAIRLRPGSAKPKPSPMVKCNPVPATPPSAQPGPLEKPLVR
ncbi:MAG TPA: hypothetical protein VJN18_32160 [Polyangiaceae bacterium]|nr:hypothetical protein [Polyangiaceae bacterium]